MVKDKPNSIRTYDEDGFRKRAACLCVRNELEDEVSRATRKPFHDIATGLSPKPSRQTDIIDFQPPPSLRFYSSHRVETGNGG